jgi:hypothetical protein
LLRLSRPGRAACSRRVAIVKYTIVTECGQVKRARDLFFSTTNLGESRTRGLAYAPLPSG